jgi:PHP family Zn ribbon phosphoesterase
VKQPDKYQYADCPKCHMPFAMNMKDFFGRSRCQYCGHSVKGLWLENRGFSPRVRSDVWDDVGGIGIDLYVNS